MMRCNAVHFGNGMPRLGNTIGTGNTMRKFATFPSIIRRVGKSGAVPPSFTARRQSDQGFDARRFPSAFGFGLAGGLISIACAGCSTVYASDIVKLRYEARGAGPKRAPGQGDIRIGLSGDAQLYLKTGKIKFLYNVNIGLYVNQFERTDWDQAGARIKILFELFDADGQLIEYFDNIYETKGPRKSLDRSTTPEKLSRVARIKAEISYNS